MIRLLDPAPALLPGALSVVPWSSIVAVLGGLLAVTAGATLLASRSARTTPAGEVLRDAP